MQITSRGQLLGLPQHVLNHFRPAHHDGLDVFSVEIRLLQVNHPDAAVVEGGIFRQLSFLRWEVCRLSLAKHRRAPDNGLNNALTSHSEDSGRPMPCRSTRLLVCGRLGSICREPPYNASLASMGR